MRILVCGGRNYNDRVKFNQVMNEYLIDADLTIIEGGAIGADYLAFEWAVRNNIEVEEYRAPWEAYGAKAGPIRNQKMLDNGKPDLVIAFPGKKGTADMVNRAKKAGVPVREIT